MFDTVHAPETVQLVLALRAEGLGARRISARTGIPVRTVSDWLRGKTPNFHAGAGACCDGNCAPAGELPPEYVYLLGLYLGDGNLSAYPRGVFRLRVFLDARYPRIIDACDSAIAAVMPGNRIKRQLRDNNCVEVSAYSKHWPCLFPQHGPGKKHTRAIALEPWQQELVEQHPRELIRGLIHSDGCRFINTGRGGWVHPRYSFRNLSAEIRAIFCAGCDLLGLRWTAARDTIYVSRKADVALLDEFIGPKC